MSFSRTKCTTLFFYPLPYLKKKTNSPRFTFLRLLSLSSHSAAFKVSPPLCSCKPALCDLTLNIASGFSSFQIWNSLTFYCGSLALRPFLFHWKPHSQMQQIHRHTLFCYCLKDQLQLVLSWKFHIHSFQPSKPIQLKCSGSICFESSAEGAWCSSRRSFKYTHFWSYQTDASRSRCCKSQLGLFHQVLLHLRTGVRKMHPGRKAKIPIGKDHAVKVNVAIFSLDCVFKASALREGFGCCHCTNQMNNEGVVWRQPVTG